MNHPYRKYQPYLDTELPKMTTYKYILRKEEFCPVCKDFIKEQVYQNYNYSPNPDFLLCHSFKRIAVKGMWWWKKYCPVEGIHRHITCKKCSISWISMHPDQSEANPDIKEVYL